MKILSAVVLLPLFCPMFVGCATDRSANRVPEKTVVQAESPERYDALLQQIKGLEQSVAALRSEIAASKKDDALARQLKDLEQSVSSLRSEMGTFEDRLRRIRSRPPLDAYKLPGEVTLCGERVPVEDRNVWENLDREFLLVLSNEAQILLWRKRAKRYFPHIEKRLRELGLPDDLKYVTITESALRPEAVSSSGAGGIWQFIPSTGERYGMKKDRALDERFDFFKATEGALTYLKSLYDEFNSWTLAMAAYNAGENRVRKEIELQETRDYFHLDLPAETERYVYKIAIAKVILSDPERYGTHLEEKDCYDPFQVERVEIEVTRALPLVEVARALGYYYKEIKEMNPHLSNSSLLPGIHFLNLPPGTAEKFWTFFRHWERGSQDK